MPSMRHGEQIQQLQEISVFHFKKLQVLGGSAILKRKLKPNIACGPFNR